MSLSLFVPLEPLVNKEHAYRKFLQLLDFEWLTKPLLALENTEVGRYGYALSKGFRMLLLQCVKDLSDRELESYYKKI